MLFPKQQGLIDSIVVMYRSLETEAKIRIYMKAPSHPLPPGSLGLPIIGETIQFVLDQILGISEKKNMVQSLKLIF